jgi:two-component system, cell cycle sensor histidine kinase and response regulator CckA
MSDHARSLPAVEDEVRRLTEENVRLRAKLARERGEAEQQVGELADVQRALLNAVDIGVSYLKRRKLQWVNATWVRMFGYEADELLGVDSSMFYTDMADYRRVGEGYAQLAQGAGYGTEALMKRKDGTTFWCSINGQAVDLNNQAAGSIWVLLDITTRKNAEHERATLQGQLQQATKMEAVGLLAGGIAHDFNNLLTAIAGNIDLIRLDLAPADPILQQLNEMQKATDSAASLTRQLLAFSRRQMIEPKLLDLNDLIQHLERMLARLIGEDISLQTLLGADLSTVRVDPGQFEQVLVNLAVNARDAMPDGGRLTIETANVYLDDNYCVGHAHVAPGAYVRLAVSDTGLGMTEEVRQRVFEPFFTTKPRERGTGLGLATIFGTVKQSGGTVEVYSELNLGTTFKIHLPAVAEPAERLAQHPPSGDLAKGHETVLLVEDEGSVRDLARHMLKRLGYSVLHASNGGEAFMVAEKYVGDIDLLMTDVVMPGMNGRELAERLLRLRPGMKVLYSSGYTENVIVHHGIVDKDLNFIGKPYSLHGLAAKLREVLDAPGERHATTPM